MLFMTTAIALFAMCGVALGGPVGEHGARQERKVNIFQYRQEANLRGACNLDWDIRPNDCVPSRMTKSGASVLVYRHFECVLFLDAYCQGKGLVQKSGKNDLLPHNFRNKFRAYKCYRV